MNFANPAWLKALFLLPLLYAAFVWHLKRRQKAFEAFANPKLWDAIAPELDWKAKLRKAAVLLASLAFAILALARPQWGRHEETLKLSGLDVLIALDVSNSMEVEDVVPSRLKKAKHLVRNLTEKLDGDRVGVVAFAASSYLACPLTTDMDYVREVVEILGPRSITNQGTDISIALETAWRALERGAQEVGKKKVDTPSASRVVVLISDGEDHEEGALATARKLRDSGITLFVIGVGTPGGGPIPVRDDEGQLHGYKHEANGKSIVSTFNPKELTELASAGGGTFWGATPNESEVDELLGKIGAMNRGEYAERKMVVYEDRFQIPLVLSLLLLLLEMAIPSARRKKATHPAAAILLAICILGGNSAHASPGDQLKTYLENQKGLKAFQEDKLDEAKRDFGEAQALNPDSPELLFNQGAVEMKQGEADKAIQSFESAAQSSAQKGNPGLEARSYYNLGNALAGKGDHAGAVRAYMNGLGALKKSPNPEAQLDSDIRKNIELVQKQQQQQKQQKQDQQKQDQKQQQDQKKDDQKQDQQKQQDQKQDQKQNQNKDQKQDQDKDQKQDNQPKQYTRRPQFKSEKLSKEDADRVMSELSNREKQLQSKLKKQRGGAQTGQKDW